MSKWWTLKKTGSRYEQKIISVKSQKLTLFSACLKIQTSEYSHRPHFDWKVKILLEKHLTTKVKNLSYVIHWATPNMKNSSSSDRKLWNSESFFTSVASCAWKVCASFEATQNCKMLKFEGSWKDLICNFHNISWFPPK